MILRKYDKTKPHNVDPMLLEDHVEISAAHAFEVIAQIEACRNRSVEPTAPVMDNALRQTYLDRTTNRDGRNKPPKKKVKLGESNAKIDGA